MKKIIKEGKENTGRDNTFTIWNTYKWTYTVHTHIV